MEERKEGRWSVKKDRDEGRRRMEKTVRRKEGRGS
jgi:hypothetical protein